MFDYKAVPSGVRISHRIANRLEATAPVNYQIREHIRAVHAINDILQGRSSRSVMELLTELELYGGEEFISVQADIRSFLRQKELLTTPYNKLGQGTVHVVDCLQTFDGRQLKVINQELYDRAAREGFSPDFFQMTYFDNVTFYCLPDNADFFGAELHGCKFAVCRICNVSFVDTYMTGVDFYTSILSHVDFRRATLTYTLFQDCELSHVMFQIAAIEKSCAVDCTLDCVDFAGATLDGDAFRRVTVGTIRNLDQAIITQSGATEEECRRNRQAIYQALGVAEVAA